MHKRLFMVLVFLLTAACFTIPLQAQDEQAGTAAEVIMITANPGEGAALEAAIRDYHYWVADKPGAFRYNWYAILSGSNTGKYIARSGNHNWSDFDEEFDWQEEADAKLAEMVMPHVKHMTRWYTEEMEDYAHWPEDFSDYTHFQIEDWYIKPGKGAQFREGLATIHGALSEAGYSQHFGFHSSVSGRHSNEVTLVLPMKGFAGFGDKDPSFASIVSEAMGGMDEFGAFMSEWSATFKAGESFLLELLPEASDYGDDE